MTGPDGNGQWCRVEIKTVDTGRGFTSVANFCDEDGNIVTGFPNGYWSVQFFADGAGTRAEIELTFDNEADLQQIVEMGFEEGFSMGLSNLDELLAE
jgi:hypothetical protein